MRILTLLILALSPRFVCTHDRREFDGCRYVSVCGGLYQHTSSFVCAELRPWAVEVLR